jgi:Uncharacterised nucleotidyltransferase
MPEHKPVASPEWSLLLATCSASPPTNANRILPLLRKPLQWPVLLQLADRHGVVPLLHQALVVVEDQVPPEQMHWLKERYRTNIHKSLFLTRELIRILDCFDSVAIEVMPYKGVTLAETTYGDMALRQSGDIDMLIRPNDVTRAKDALRELGYVPQLKLSPAEENAYLISGYESAFDSSLGRNLLELQWALQPRFYAVDADMHEMFRRGVTVSVGGRRLKTLSSEDLLLVLSVHAAKHVWARLVWLCDIARVMGAPNLNWSWILDQSKALGIMRILSVTLLLTKQMLKVEAPKALDEVIAEDREVLTLTHQISLQIFAGTACDVESVTYFRLLMRLRERRADRMRFLTRLAFTPGPNEWKAIHLPAPLFSLYRIVRLSRLAARLMGV